MADRPDKLVIESVESFDLADAGLVLVTVNVRGAGRPPISPRLLVATADRDTPVRVPPTDVRTGEEEAGGVTRWSAVFSLPERLRQPSTRLALDTGHETIGLPRPVSVGTRPPAPRPAVGVRAPGRGSGSRTDEERESLSRALAEADERLADVQSTLSQARATRPPPRERPDAVAEPDAGPVRSGPRPVPAPREESTAPGKGLDDADRRLAGARSALSGVRQDAEREAQALVAADRALADAKEAVDGAREEVRQERRASDERLQMRLQQAQETWARQLDAAEERIRGLEATEKDVAELMRRLTEAEKTAERHAAEREQQRQQAVAERERERAEHTAQLARAHAEHEAELQRRSTALVAELEQLRTELERARAESEGKLRALEAGLNEERERARGEATLRARAEAERQAAMVQAERARAEAVARREEVERARHEAERERTRANAEIAEAERTRATARADAERARTELEAERLDRARAEAALERRLAQAEAAAEAAVARVRRETEEILRQQTDPNREAERRREHDELQRRAEAAEQALRAAEARAAEAQTATEQAQASIEALQAEVEQLRSVEDRESKRLTLQLESERKARQEAIELVDRERERSASELRKVRAAAAEREQELAAELEQRSGLEARIGEMTAELQQQLEQVRERISEREAALAELQAKLERERARRTQLEEELSRERAGAEQRLTEATAHAEARDRGEQDAVSVLAERVGRTTGELRDQLQDATERLEAALASERGAREQAEAELRQQRERADADRAAARRSAERARRLERELSSYRRVQKDQPLAGADGPSVAETAEPAEPPAPPEEKPPLAPAEQPAAEQPRAEPSDAPTPEAGEAMAAPPEQPAASSPEPPVEPLEPAPASVTAPASEPARDGDWLIGSLPKLARDDAVAAGQLLVALLPAQGLIAAADVDYDLQLAEVGRFAVRVHRGRAEIEPLRAGRPPETLDFEVEANAVGLAEVVSGQKASRLRRSGRLRVRGRDRRDAALPELARHSIGLPELAGLGLEINPVLVYQALRWAVEPSWTRGHRFCVAHEVLGERGETCFIAAADGRRLSVGLSPEGEVTATIRSPAGDFLALLAGLQADVEVRGDTEHVDLLQDWISRAQGSVSARA